MTKTFKTISSFLLLHRMLNCFKQEMEANRKLFQNSENFIVIAQCCPEILEILLLSEQHWAINNFYQQKVWASIYFFNDYLQTYVAFKSKHFSVFRFSNKLFQRQFITEPNGINFSDSCQCHQQRCLLMFNIWICDENMKYLMKTFPN